MSKKKELAQSSSSSELFQFQESKRNNVAFEDYEGSEFEYNHYPKAVKIIDIQNKVSITTKNININENQTGISKTSKKSNNEAQNKAEGQVPMFHYMSMNAYSKHKKLCNDYLRYYGKGQSFSEIFKCDKSFEKNDLDVIREQIQFVWDDKDLPDSWEKRLAKRYYDKLFKEYCLCDLTYYKQNKVAMRWRVEKEVIEGKGQFICGNKTCQNRNNLKSWEVNFAYTEQNSRKNALVKIRLCPECSIKLNYHHQKKEVKKEKKKIFNIDEEIPLLTKRKSMSSSYLEKQSEDSSEIENKKQKTSIEQKSSIQSLQNSSLLEEKNEDMIVIQSSNVTWKDNLECKIESREDIFETYLEDLLL